ncbi:hypothetical protein B0H16DRAFT_311602 [Mycena metata]|uniref:Zn(2)-C6 fungal-type domain-containing protein n=1 Tax=Mycena metata TaxID=1033252 RepID=A0AAD7NMP7_9AGAR|nr:hypothetical protein B0H16DRAFT_311602 [Mycena metata]
MPSPQPPEKSKKVSRACNTCRLKRKKCDGLEPCIFCTETKVECSYSREPRRRGPPSGYLKNTETRVTLLETLLGLFIQTAGPQTAQGLFDAVQTLRKESSTNTQEIWDAYKVTWTDSDASRAVHDLAGLFAPFSPAENQTPAVKPLLPLSGKQSQAPPPPPSLPARSPSPFPATLSYRNESFERTVTHEPTMQSEIPPLHEQNPPAPQQVHLPHVVDMDLSMPMFLPPPSSTGAATPSYTGAYWRTAALTSPSSALASLPLPLSPTLADLSFPPTAPPIADLPPQHLCAALLAAYHTDVHPSLPILSPTQCAPPNPLEATPMLLLALCAYTARLAPLAVPTRVAADVWYESASALLFAALRRAVVSFDVVQTLLFLALRDHGRARDAMAWRGIGAAVRVAVELGLDGSETNSRESTTAGEDVWKRGLWGVVSMLDLFLSIQLSHAPASAEALRPLSFSPRPSLNSVMSMNTPTIMNALPSPSPSVASAATSPSTTLFRSTPIHNSSAGREDAHDSMDLDDDTALFAYMRTLVRIITRVHFCVTLGYGETPLSPTSSTGTSSTTSFLRDELAAWHRGLPQRFRVALGGERVPRAVLEAHMLYQVGVGMLASTGSSVDTDAAADEATSTFNVLLDKYRPSLALAGPHVVWLVFAAARAGLRRSPAKNGLGVGVGPGTARALQTQLYLLNCREALAAMGETWELARRCAHTLERLMEGGESRPQSSNAGKRKREDEAGEEGESSGAKRRDVARVRGEDGAPGWAEQFDFDAGWGVGMGSDIDPFGMSVDGLWGADGGSAGLWGAGQWDESLWGRNMFSGGQLTPGTGRGLGMGLGLFDAPPGG